MSEENSAAPNYKIVPAAGWFTVEVSVPGQALYRGATFGTEAEAADWIAARNKPQNRQEDRSVTGPLDQVYLDRWRRQFDAKRGA